MKKLLLFSLLILPFCAYAQEEYILEINDTALNVQLDKPYELMINNEKINMVIRLKDTLSYSTGFYSFQYPSDFKISKMTVAEGIEQVMLMTAEGSGLIIQHYSTMNPTMLNEIMLSEVTKESVNYGYTMEREDYERTLRSGETVNVDKAVLNYKSEVNIYEVASYGKKDEGILVMTMVINEDTSPVGIKLIDMMWNTLTIK